VKVLGVFQIGFVFSPFVDGDAKNLKNRNRARQPAILDFAIWTLMKSTQVYDIH